MQATYCSLIGSVFFSRTAESQTFFTLYFRSIVYLALSTHNFLISFPHPLVVYAVLLHTAYSLFSLFAFVAVFPLTCFFELPFFAYFRPPEPIQIGYGLQVSGSTALLGKKYFIQQKWVRSIQSSWLPLIFPSILGCTIEATTRIYNLRTPFRNTKWNHLGRGATVTYPLLWDLQPGSCNSANTYMHTFHIEEYFIYIYLYSSFIYLFKYLHVAHSISPPPQNPTLPFHEPICATHVNWAPARTWRRGTVARPRGRSKLKMWKQIFRDRWGNSARWVTIVNHCEPWQATARKVSNFGVAFETNCS